MSLVVYSKDQDKGFECPNHGSELAPLDIPYQDHKNQQLAVALSKEI